ncbi:MAG: hypothetical protein AAF633_03660 [Chloroflexota bacterium]
MNRSDIDFSEYSRYQKIQFYQNFAFELTISIRTVWGNPTLLNHQKIEIIQALNEVMHLAHKRLKDLLAVTSEFDDDDVWRDIEHQMAQAEALDRYLPFAFDSGKRVADASSHISLFIDDYDN